MEIVIGLCMVGLACIGGLTVLAEWLGLFGDRHIANRWMLCEECLLKIRTGSRVLPHSNGGYTHLQCRE